MDVNDEVEAYSHLEQILTSEILSCTCIICLPKGVEARCLVRLEADIFTGATACAFFHMGYRFGISLREGLGLFQFLHVIGGWNPHVLSYPREKNLHIILGVNVLMSFYSFLFNSPA